MSQSERQEEMPGVHFMVPREQMIAPAVKLRDAYNITPDAPIYRREFSFYCLHRWYKEGLGKDEDLAERFGYDPVGRHTLNELGWTEAEFCPEFEEKVLENRGEYELVQDHAGRSVLFFAGRRDGFMPQYIDHPVKDMKTWEEKCKWRLDPTTPQRWEGFEQRMAKAQADARQGMMVTQQVIGGYMYLRSLIGPSELPYMFYDQPGLLHDCMQTWLKLADAVIARVQQYVTIDEIFFGEDICYNHGALCSPEMIREFFIPYYQQLIGNLRSRQLDPTRHLYVQIDTDGYSIPIIDLYHEEIGMDVMMPFEVASGCDVVEVGRQYPWLVIRGGIDKRILAKSEKAIDEMVDRIIPTMRHRGGYIPMCDHGVPEEVSLENYEHYRKRMNELCG